MNIKPIMNKLAIGVAVAGAAAIGYCSNNNKNVDNYYETDIVEISETKTETVSNPIEKTYEPIEELSESTQNIKPEERNFDNNAYLSKRVKRNHGKIYQKRHKDDVDNEGLYNYMAKLGKELDKSYKTYGIYGASMREQMLLDFGFMHTIDGPITELSSKVRSEVGFDKESHPEYPTLKKYKDMQMTRYRALESTQEELLRKMDDEIFVDGVPNSNKCLTYLDRLAAGLDFLSIDDYEKYQEKCKKFEESFPARNTHNVAELIAFKQYQIDSMIIRNINEEVGAFKDIKIRRYLEEGMQDDYETLSPKLTYPADYD